MWPPRAIALTALGVAVVVAVAFAVRGLSTPDASAPPSEIPSATDEWKPFGEREKAIVPTATPRIPAIRTQFVMLWLTKVPPDGDGTYTGVVNEITVEGPAT